MEQLTRFEKAFLEAVLEREKSRTEEYLENNGNSFEAYFAKNETLPMIENLLKKFES